VKYAYKNFYWPKYACKTLLMSELVNLLVRGTRLDLRTVCIFQIAYKC